MQVIEKLKTAPSDALYLRLMPSKAESLMSGAIEAKINTASGAVSVTYEDGSCEDREATDEFLQSDAASVGFLDLVGFVQKPRLA